MIDSLRPESWSSILYPFGWTLLLVLFEHTVIQQKFTPGIYVLSHLAVGHFYPIGIRWIRTHDLFHSCCPSSMHRDCAKRWTSGQVYYAGYQRMNRWEQTYNRCFSFHGKVHWARVLEAHLWDMKGVTHWRLLCRYETITVDIHCLQHRVLPR